jgi:hypothetical protein
MPGGFIGGEPYEELRLAPRIRVFPTLRVLGYRFQSISNCINFQRRSSQHFPWPVGTRLAGPGDRHLFAPGPGGRQPAGRPVTRPE